MLYGRSLSTTDVIELRKRQVAHKSPGLAAVPADGNTAVIAEDQMTRVVGVDPEGMVVDVDRVSSRTAVDDRVQLEGFAAVD